MAAHATTSTSAYSGRSCPSSPRARIAHLLRRAFGGKRRARGRGAEVSVVLREHRGHGGDRLALVEVHHAHARCITALRRDVAHGGADHDATGRDHEDLVVDTDHERGHHEALLRRQLDRPDTLPTTTLPVEVLELRPLAVPRVGDDQHGDVVATRVEGHDLVARTQLHAAHAGGGAAHRAHVVLAEADALAELRDHEDVVAPVRGDDLHELVAVAQVDGDETGTQRRVVLVELRLLHLALLRGEEEEAVRLVVARVDDGLDALLGLELQQVHDGGAARGALLHRDLVRLEPVHAPAVGEEQQVRVRRGGEDLRDVVLVAELRARHTPSAASLRAERVGRHRLHVALRRQRDDQVFVVDEVFDVDVAGVEGDLAAAVGGELVADVAELGLDDLAQLLVGLEDRLQLLDRVAQLGDLLLEVDAGQAGQATEGHVEDVLRLHLAELERLRHEPLTRRGAVFGAADQRDHVVDDVERLQQTFADVRLLLRLVEAVLRPAADDLHLVRDVDLERLLEVQRARHAVDERDHVDGEVRLQRRVLVEVVEHDERGRVTLELDHETRLALRGLVVDVGDALDLA